MQVMQARPPIATLLRVLLGAALSVGPAPGQETIDLPDVFSEAIDVRVLDLEVVVHDDRGRRVSGIGPDALRVLVDGEPRPIRFFSEIRDGEALGPGADADYGPAPGLEAEGLGTSYLVFVDDSFSHARDRDRVLTSLASELSLLGPRDRMAVVAFDGEALAVLRGWTSERSVLQRTLRGARQRPAHGRRRLREMWAVDAARHGSWVGGDELPPRELRYAARLARQVQAAVFALTASMRTLSVVPGRKVVLLLAGGWPISPAEYAVHSASGSLREALAAAYRDGIPGYDTLLGPAVDTANLLGYTIYPVDVPGRAGRLEPGARLSLFDDPALGGLADDASGGDPDFWGREGNRHKLMAVLAAETGGRAWIHDERDRVLQDTFNDTRSYYWLGVPLTGGGDDRRHALSVEVSEPGLTARFRAGFVDVSRRREMSELVESSLLFGSPVSRNPVSLRFGRAEKSGRRDVAIPLRIGVPLAEIVLVPVARGLATDVELRIGAIDDDGRRVATVSETVRVELSADPQPDEVFWHETEVVLPQRPHRVVVGVFDPLGGRIFSTAAEIFP
jgi:VWFA-related protein